MNGHRLVGIPVRPAAPSAPGPAGRDRPSVLDVRGVAAAQPLTVCWPAGDRVIVSGLPGSGKSTLMRRVPVARGSVVRIDSQDVRERWERWLPGWLPYPVYRPVVRGAHYLRLWRSLRSSAGVLVHDCGRASWVRRWLARDTRRRGLGLHLLLLDVAPATALAGQAARGRGVSAAVFDRHRRALARLLAEVETGHLPSGCVSVTLLDGAAAGALGRIGFAGTGPDADETPS